MSLILRDWPPLLPLIAPVAVCDVVGEGALVKWPNDVVVRQGDGLREPLAGKDKSPGSPLSKLAGILIEGRPQEGWLVLGIGLNVAVDLDDLPAELRGVAASMGLPSGAIEGVLEELLDALERRLGETREQTLAAWRARDALRGETVSWSGGEGVAIGVDDGGRLLVERANRSVDALDSGEVRMVRQGG